MAVPTLVVSFSTDPADDATPTWTDVTADVRSFSISRGRESELGTVDAGTAEIVLSNRAGDYDPTLHASVGPMNRWKIETVLSGPTTEVLFLGYAEAYVQQWPATGMDALVTVQLADEFKRLALDRLPTMDPPRDTYADVVLFDQPAAYWRMNDEPTTRSRVGAIGPELVAEGATTVASLNDGAIVGDNPDPYGAFFNAASSYVVRRFENGDIADPLIVAGLAAITVECWFDTDDITPAAEEILMHGPTTGGATSWRLVLNTGGTVKFEARNSAGTLHTVTSGVLTAGSPPSSPTWKHIVGTIESGNVRLYVNGTQVASTAWTGTFHGTFNAGSSVYVSDLAPLSNYVFDEVAFYRYGLPADRVLAHYDAGRNRGFLRGDLPGDRADDILAASDSIAASNTRTGTRTMTGSFMHGQSPLDELRKCEQAEGVDAVLFIARDGTITFLDDGHRAVSPWDTVQATFDDDGTDIPYQDIAIDESDSFIANAWHVTRTGGTTQSATDATSISDYGQRPQSLTDLPITDDSDAQDIADAMLAKYKDPMERITSLGVLTKTTTVSDTVLPLDIGDRIRVFRTRFHSGGGRIDQTLFVQKIEIAGTPGTPWRIRLGVSPL